MTYPEEVYVTPHERTRLELQALSRTRQWMALDLGYKGSPVLSEREEKIARLAIRCLTMPAFVDEEIARLRETLMAERDEAVKPPGPICRSTSEFGKCSRTKHLGRTHAVEVGGGVWFFYRGRRALGYRKVVNR